MIAKTLVINLDERTDRWNAQQGVCGLQDVPYTHLERVPAHDSLDYENMDAVVEAMTAEGWDYAKYAEHYRGYVGWVTHTILCVQWSHLDAIKQAIDSNTHILVLEDDSFLNINYAKLNYIYKWLVDNHGCDILYLDSNPIKPFYEKQLNPIVVPICSVDAEGLVTDQLDDTFAVAYGNFRFSSCRARVYSPLGAGRMLDIMRTTGLVTEWIPLHLHELNRRNDKTILYPDTAFHWLKDGAKDIGWRGYNFGNRSDIIARDVGVFGHVYDDKYLKGVELKRAKGKHHEVPLDETP